MTTKPTQIRALLGLLLIVFSLVGLFVFRQQAQNPLVYFTLIVVLALGAGLLASFLTGLFKYSRTSDTDGNRERFEATGGFLAFAGVLALGIYFYENANQTFDFVIYLRNPQGETVSQNQGKLRLLLNNRPQDEPIDQYGKVNLAGIDAQLKDASVRAELVDSPAWSFTNGTKADTVSLTGKDATLYLTPSEDLCCIRGVVMYDGGAAIPKATVWINTLPPTQSDSLGRFTIQLPPKQQKEESVRVFARKDRYSVSTHATPRQETTLLFPLHR